MGVFGRKVFKKKKQEELYDFAQHGLISGSNGFITISDINLMAVSGDDDQSKEYMDGVSKHNKKKAEKPKVTPKGLYELESLNLPNMQLKTDGEYLDKEIKLLEKKIKLMPGGNGGNEQESYSSYGAVKYGRKELESLVIRMNNRRKFAEYKEFYDEYPYTTSDKIVEVVDHYSNLKTARVEEFVPDMPEEALDAMEAYTKNTKELCGLKPVFYIIADRKDFEKTTKKRDPVLLAQSPFGLVWQILGAWDEEMVLLEEL